MTIGDNPIAERFFRICETEVGEYVTTSILRNEANMGSRNPLTKDDAVIFFNRNDQEYSKSILSLLREAADREVTVYPIALTRAERIPPRPISEDQSYDVYENLRRRKLTEANIDTVAFALARKVVADLQPTLSIDSGHLFISHRRVDGEEIAAKLSDALLSRSHEHFRDVLHVEVGQKAQEQIEENLRKCDAVIFIDTPKSGESFWVERELRLALSYNLPIIWIKLGPDDDRVPLPILPAEKPHFEDPEFNLVNGEFETSFIDEVIQLAFRMIRKNSATVFDQIDTLKEIAHKHGFQLNTVDRKSMIFEVRIPRKGFRYNQLPMTQLVQFFGRSPKETDIESINPIVHDLGYVPHPKLGEVIDSTLMLAPIAARERIGRGATTCVIDSFDDYLSSLKEILEPVKQSEVKKKGIIISGAFPDCEPEHQQNLTDAIHAFVQTIFERRGVVIFGAHPTFQHLIFDLGKRLRPADYKKAIHLYCSKYFVTDPVIEELAQQSTVVATDVVDGSRGKSLTVMRNSMINDDQAIALIALGGKTDANGHIPGVDEEIRLAKGAGLPIFLVGSVGGRTAQLASKFNENGWKNHGLNDLTPEDNQELMVSLDYRVMANKVLDFLGL